MNGSLALVLMCVITVVGPDAAERPSESHAWDSLVTQLGVEERSYLLIWNADEQGLLLLDEHLKLFPRSPHREEAMYLKAVGFWGLYRYPDAAEAFATYLEEYPGEPRATIAMARHVQCLVRADRADDAIAAVKAYESQPAGEQRQLSLVDALLLQGRLDAAKNQLQAMIDAAQVDPRMGRMVDMLLAKKVQLSWIGNPLPAFEVKAWKTGELINASTFRDQVLLIEFWATWCKPCMAQLTHLVSLYDRFHEQGFDILGVSLDDRPSRLEVVVEQQGMKWPQYNDGRKWDNAMAVAFDVHRIPFAILVDRAGIVRYVGPPPASLDRLIPMLLKPRSIGKAPEEAVPGESEH